MKTGIGDILEKTLTNVIVAENERDPKQRVFFVFSDDTYFEFYGKSFDCNSGVYQGGLEKASQYAETMGDSTIKIYPA